MTLDQQKALAMAAARARSANAAPPAQPAPSLGQQIGNYAGGIEQSLYDLPQSALELGARGTDALGLTHSAYPTLHKEFQGARQFEGDPNSTMFKGGELGGQVATMLPMGGASLPAGIAAKAPTLAKIANGALQGSQAAALTSASSDAPLGQQLALGAAGGAALPALGAGLRLGGSIGKNILGATTGAGASSIENAYKAGLAGGDQGSAFTTALNNPDSWGSVVQDAKTAVSTLKQQRAAAYNSGMVDISKDASILDFKPVDDAMAKAASVKNFNGKDLDPDTAAVRKKVTDAIKDWRTSDPATFHTPAGFDALKQMLGNFKDAEQYGSPAWKVANDAYSAVRNTIAKQAPTYDKVMGDYSAASDQLKELEKELSLGKGGNPNTALRKLQSVMRDNVNTSWGKRAQLAGDLQDAGATNLMPSLAGQALSSPLPRGLARYGDLATGLTVAGTTHGLGAPLLLAASPKLVGNAAYGLGAAQRGATNLGQKIPIQLPNLPQSNLSSILGTLAPQLLLQGAH
jgi:hypothetical protein